MNGDSSMGSYPRLYRVNSATRRALIGFGIVLVSFGVLMSVLHIVGLMKTPLATGDVLTVVFFAAFAVWISSSVSRRVILYENSIEVVGWFSKRKLTREEIRGYRIGRLAWQAGGASYFIVVPLDAHTRELKLPAFLNYDKPFYAWIKAFCHIAPH